MRRPRCKMRLPKAQMLVVAAGFVPGLFVRESAHAARRARAQNDVRQTFRRCRPPRRKYVLFTYEKDTVCTAASCNAILRDEPAKANITLCIFLFIHAVYFRGVMSSEHPCTFSRYVFRASVCIFLRAHSFWTPRCPQFSSKMPTAIHTPA